MCLESFAKIASKISRAKIIPTSYTRTTLLRRNRRFFCHAIVYKLKDIMSRSYFGWFTHTFRKSEERKKNAFWIHNKKKPRIIPYSVRNIAIETKGITSVRHFQNDEQSGSHIYSVCTIQNSQTMKHTINNNNNEKKKKCLSIWRRRSFL